MRFGLEIATLSCGRRGLRTAHVLCLFMLIVWGSVTESHAQWPAANAERVVLITGSTDGLGREVALELARPGTHIIVHGRNEERGREMVRLIEEQGGTARFYRADLANLDDVRGFAEAVRRDYDRLDVLINNAGVWLTPEAGRVLTPAGHEMHFAVNYLSHFLLTRLLLPLLEASAPSRIINVASVAQQPIGFDDVMLSRGYSDGRGYAQSKLAQVMFTFDLAAELEGRGVTVNALHPGHDDEHVDGPLARRTVAQQRRGRSGGGHQSGGVARRGHG